MRRKFLSVVLCVCMMLTMAPFAFAEGTDTGSTTEGAGTSTPANSSSGAGGGGSVSTSTTNAITNETDLRTALESANDEDTITISGTISIDAPLVITKTVTLTGGSITASDSFTANSDKLADMSLISLKTAGKVLTLKNITLDAKQKTLVVFSNAGKVVVDGATITGGKTNSYVAGVYMTSASQFEMNSGSITGNEVGDSYKTNSYTQYAADLWIGANANGALTSINGGTIGNIFVNSNEWSSKNPGCFTMAGGTVNNLYVEYDKGYGASFTYQGGTIDNLYISTTNGNGDCKKVTPVIGMAYVGGQVDKETTAPVAKVDETGYATLADAVAAAQPGVATTITMLKDVNLPNYITVNSGKDITLDLNKHNIIFAGYSVFRVKGANFHVTGEGTIFENQKDGFAPIIAGGSKENVTNYTTITIDKDVTLKGDYAGIFVDTDNGGKGSYNNYGLTINMNGSIDLTAITDGVSGYGVYVQGNNKVTTGNVMQINLNGARIKTGDEAIYAAGYAKWNLKDCTLTAENAAVELRAGEMTIDGGNYTATATEFKCEANGNGSTTQGAALAIMQHTTKLPMNINIKNGTFNGMAAVAEKNIQKNDPDPKVELTIEGGMFSGLVEADDTSNFISGGYFTVDPSTYLASDKAAVESDLAGYNYMVKEKTTTPATVASAAPSVDTTGLPKEQQAVANEITEKLDSNTVTGDGLTAAANTIANGNDITTETGKTALENNHINTTGETTRIVIQTYMDIDITAVNTTNNTLTLDITPMYRTVATTTSDDNTIKLAGENVTGANAVLVGPAGKLTINKPVTVSIPLPTSFTTGSTVYVQHKGYEYTANVSNNVATFVNPHGFSSFTITANQTAVAEVNGTSYINFQDAVDAVENGGTITALKDIDSTVSGNKSFKVSENGKTVKLTAASGYNLTKDTTGVYTVSRQSSGNSGSISAPTTYDVKVNAATNGAVAADKKTASKGTTVTVTASPSKGYVVDAVKVVDKDGKDVAVTGKGGKYVFTMPASAVTVTGSFKAETPAPVALPFTDVKSGNWFYDAVKYAYAQGLMTGTSATTFAPNGTMNRAMIVTVLYRLEKSPAVTGASKFTDVPAGQWYSDAVAWAAANKIVNGYDETTFGPMNAVTREQMAAILFRYEQYKGLENVTLEENLNRFPDQNKISAYAIPALQWAVGQKIINGNANGTLDPTGTATRAQVAQIFTNLLNQ